MYVDVHWLVHITGREQMCNVLNFFLTCHFFWTIPFKYSPKNSETAVQQSGVKMNHKSARAVLPEHTLFALSLNIRDQAQTSPFCPSLFTNDATNSTLRITRDAVHLLPIHPVQPRLSSLYSRSAPLCVLCVPHPLSP